MFNDAIDGMVDSKNARGLGHSRTLSANRSLVPSLYKRSKRVVKPSQRPAHAGRLGYTPVRRGDTATIV